MKLKTYFNGSIKHLELVSKVIDYNFSTEKRILLWSLLPNEITSCYKERCYDCFHTNHCNIVNIKLISLEEFIENILKKRNK